MNYKLDNFPSIYYITLPGEEKRDEHMSNLAKDYGVKVIPYYSDHFENLGVTLSGEYVKNIHPRAAGCSISHLLNLHRWYTETTEEYAVFAENDLSFETVQYWNFTWNEFFKLLPGDWTIIQLARINPFVSMGHEDQDGLKLRRRIWCDWGSQAYLIGRVAVKNILDRTYISDTEFSFSPPDNLYPITENLLYCQGDNYLNTVYSLPLFVEDASLKVHEVVDDYTETYAFYLKLWRENTLSITDIMVRERVYWYGKVGKNSPTWFVSEALPVKTPL